MIFQVANIFPVLQINMYMYAFTNESSPSVGIQSNLSTTATLETEGKGCCSEVAIVEWWLLVEVQLYNIIITCRVRRKCDDEVALWASYYLRLLAPRSEELSARHFLV